MPRPIRPWFRFYTEAFSDRKLLRLSPEQRWIWVSILGAARESPEPGILLIAEGIPMTSAELARYADVKERVIDRTLPTMRSLGMIDVTDETISVRNWDHRQFESDNVTERTRSHRERSQEQGRNVPKNVPGNIPETETETDKKKTTSSSPRKRATRIGEDWIPSEKVRTSLAEQFPQINLKSEHAKFVDYWIAKGGKDATKTDWDATFRNWIRNAAERTPAAARQQQFTLPGGNYFTPPAPPDDMPDHLFAAWNRAHNQAHREGRPGPDDWRELKEAS